MLVGKPKKKQEQQDEWETVVANGITCFQGYKCRKCGVVYGWPRRNHCEDIRI